MVRAKPFYADHGIPYIIQNVYGAKKIIPSGMPIPVDANEAARIMKATMAGYPHPSIWPVDGGPPDEPGDDKFVVDDFINNLLSPSSSTDSFRSKRSSPEDLADSGFETPPMSLAERAKQEFNKRTRLMAAPKRLFHVDADEEMEGPTMFNDDKGDDQFLEEVTDTPPRPTLAQREIKIEPGTTMARPAFTSPAPSILIKKKARKAPKKLATYESSI